MIEKSEKKEAYSGGRDNLRGRDRKREYKNDWSRETKNVDGNNQC